MKWGLGVFLWGLLGLASAAEPSGVIGVVLVNAGSLQLEDVIYDSDKDKHALCVGVRPVTEGYVLIQWGKNKQFMYPTANKGPVIGESRVCAWVDDLQCGQTYFWRAFSIVDKKLVVGFDHFAEFVACG